MLIKMTIEKADKLSSFGTQIGYVGRQGKIRV